MKRLILLFILTTTSFYSSKGQLPLIPAPAYSKITEGRFNFTSETKIAVPANLKEIAELFAESMEGIVPGKFSVVEKSKVRGNIELVIDSHISGNESYNIEVHPNGILISASGKAGIYYGLQTLRQMIAGAEDGSVPTCIINDSPRFEWRGVMLDVSRTFMPLNLVKRYIDLFSMYKLNVVHLHLTDDQGWRIEIKKYPLLTDIGSKFDPEFNRMGGYYSQDEIRELVKYAQLRNVMLVPEIELPGHACAALASYPSLSCNGVRPVIHTFFEGKSIHEEIFCAGKDSTYRFIYAVIDELCELFPSSYIHIGGDEAPKASWKKCQYCQKMMIENGLKNEEELQSLFVKKIGDYLRTKNKILIGWDEIIDGGMLAGNEVLMFWRGWKLSEVEKEVKAGFKVICTPTTHCYFDYPYDKISTRTIFEYEPVMPGTKDSNYLGVQANFWSHIDRSENNIDKQLFPRILGLAETAWCNPENKNWERFRLSANKNIAYLKSQFVNIYNDSTLVIK